MRGKNFITDLSFLDRAAAIIEKGYDQDFISRDVHISMRLERMNQLFCPREIIPKTGARLKKRGISGSVIIFIRFNGAIDLNLADVRIKHHRLHDI